MGFYVATQAKASYTPNLTARKQGNNILTILMAYQVLRLIYLS